MTHPQLSPDILCRFAWCTNRRTCTCTDRLFYKFVLEYNELPDAPSSAPRAKELRERIDILYQAATGRNRILAVRAGYSHVFRAQCPNWDFDKYTYTVLNGKRQRNKPQPHDLARTQLRWIKTMWMGGDVLRRAACFERLLASSKERKS